MPLINVKAQGVAPIMFNRFPLDEALAANGTQPKASRQKGTPKEEAEKKTYRTPDGKLYLPGPNLQAALIEAGRSVKVGKRQLSTASSSQVPAFLIVVEPEIPLLADGEPIKEFVADSRPVVVPSTGGRIVCHRPRVDEWELEFTLDWDDSEFNENIVRELVDRAGKNIGLCEFRPSRKGMFGRFVVTSWKVEKQSKAAKKAA